MDERFISRRIARLKAKRLYDEMQAEGLGREDLPAKIREVAEREEAVAVRIAERFGIDVADARPLVQLALGDERAAAVGAQVLMRGSGVMQALAAMTIVNGEPGGWPEPLGSDGREPEQPQ